MPPICGACDQVVALGALRCRHCGTHLGSVGIHVGVTLGTDDLCPSDSRAGRALQLLDEIERRAPELLAWLGSDPATRGARPPVDVDVLEIYAQARRLYFPDG